MIPLDTLPEFVYVVNEQLIMAGYSRKSFFPTSFELGEDGTIVGVKREFSHRRPTIYLIGDCYLSKKEALAVFEVLSKKIAPECENCGGKKVPSRDTYDAGTKDLAFVCLSCCSGSLVWRKDIHEANRLT